MTEQSAIDITYGLAMDQLAEMTPSQFSVIATLLARAAEDGFRQGFVQAANAPRGQLPPDVDRWRLDHSLDASPDFRFVSSEASLDRLYARQPGLRAAGFPERLYRLGTWDTDALIAEGATLLRNLRRHVERSGWEGEANRSYQRIQSFGQELYARGGLSLMVNVYDGIVEAFEFEGETFPGMGSAWSGVGGPGVWVG